MAVINGVTPLCYTAFNGHFGNNLVRHMVLSMALHLIPQRMFKKIVLRDSMG
jgi:hypothetical protein